MLGRPSGRSGRVFPWVLYLRSGPYSRSRLRRSLLYFLWSPYYRSHPSILYFQSDRYSRLRSGLSILHCLSDPSQRLQHPQSRWPPYFPSGPSHPSHSRCRVSRWVPYCRRHPWVPSHPYSWLIQAIRLDLSRLYCLPLSVPWRPSVQPFQSVPLFQSTLSIPSNRYLQCLSVLCCQSHRSGPYSRLPSVPWRPCCSRFRVFRWVPYCR